MLTLLETILLEQRRLKKRLDVIENSLDSSLKASGSISSGGPSDMDKSLLESLNFPAKCWNELVNINETLADKEIFQNMVGLWVCMWCNLLHAPCRKTLPIYLTYLLHLLSTSHSRFPF